ncbi:MAG: glycosyltransferase [Planctomycetota bacterium]|jgi:glycosyltransferase involved in cell wall biosynthesis|nr:glycosyltransferase [Planctomycetota bacterium]MDP6762384.1 glycosyltransferase [Planctomycetota bacterium]MDP6988845.1 glycosyltransferase [Planctomycetota bacterium]
MARRILHVRITTGTGGGPEKTIVQSPRFLAGTGFEAEAAVLHPHDDPGFPVLERRAAEAGCPLTGIAERGPISPRALARLAALCREREIGIWHGHDYKSNLYGVLLRRRLGLRLVTTVHGWVRHTWKTPLYYAIDRWTLRHHDQVVCVSRDLFERCAATGVAPERLHLIENAIDTTAYTRRTPAGATGRLRIGAVGRLSEEKGFDLLIEAVERCVAEGLDLELTIAGEGHLRGALEQRIAAAAEPRRFRLVGFREDTRALFEGFDLFCLSSLREGLPNVVLEAMAMEVPILATRSGGMDAFANDGTDALLIEPGSAGELAAGIARLARDPDLRARLARSGRERVCREVDFSRRMERMVEVYERLD